MRQPMIRFTVRRMMVVVALVAVAIGATLEVKRLGRLSREYRRRAVTSAREERMWRREAKGEVASELEARCLSDALRAKDQDLADLWAEQASASACEIREVGEILNHHARLRRKYERAASRPWEPVAPDPPEPHLTPVWNCVRLPKEPLPPGERWYAEQAERRRVTALPRWSPRQSVSNPPTHERSRMIDESDWTIRRFFYR